MTTVWILDYEIRDYDEVGSQVQGVYSTIDLAEQAGQRFADEWRTNPHHVLIPHELQNGCPSFTLEWTRHTHESPDNGSILTISEAVDPNLHAGIYSVYPMTVDGD